MIFIMHISAQNPEKNEAVLIYKEDDQWNPSSTVKELRVNSQFLGTER